MVFRREPVLQLAPNLKGSSGIWRAFPHDVDLGGTTLDSYAKNIVSDVVSVGRAGTLVDWQGGTENRGYLSMYAAESIINWREIRIDGQMKLSLVVLAETASG